VITPTLEGRTQADVARAYGVSKSWVSKLVARYRHDGEAAFTLRSRRPNNSPQRLTEDLIERICTLRHELTTQGLDAGPTTIAWHLATHHHTRVSTATISRHLTRLRLVEPQPKKRPRSSYIRFQAAMPNQTWQSDVTHYRLTTGTEAKILTWLDDCSRYALSVTGHHNVTAKVVLTSFRHAIATHGTPASTLTDNGMVCTTRFAGGIGGRSALEHELRRLNITQKNARPNHPTTCGKVERFQ
jgi:transposase InsO family protein